MKLKKIIKYLDKFSNVIIWVTDLNSPEPTPTSEKVFEGHIRKIPWYLLDYELDYDENGEAEPISVEKFVDGTYGFTIYLIDQ